MPGRLFSLSLRCVGTVQGVGFRMHVLRIAGDMGLTGFVRNEDDESVSVFAEGDEESLLRLKKRISGLHHFPGPDVKELQVIEEKEIKSRTFDEFQVQ